MCLGNREQGLLDPAGTTPHMRSSAAAVGMPRRSFLPRTRMASDLFQSVHRHENRESR